MSARQQSMFDKVLFHIRMQGKPSLNEKGCRYRGPDKTKCAAGVLIFDSEYHPAMEGVRINCLDELLPKRLKRNVRLMQAMQHAHDGAADDHIYDDVEDSFVGYFNERMQKVARQFHLRYTPPLS